MEQRFINQLVARSPDKRSAIQDWMVLLKGPGFRDASSGLRLLDLIRIFRALRARVQTSRCFERDCRKSSRARHFEQRLP